MVLKKKRAKNKQEAQTRRLRQRNPLLSARCHSPKGCFLAPSVARASNRRSRRSLLKAQQTQNKAHSKSTSQSKAHSKNTSRLPIRQPYSQCVCTIFIDKTCTRRKVGVTQIAQGRVRGLELQPSHGTRCLRWQTPELAGLSRRGVGNELSDQLSKSSKHVVGAAACLEAHCGEENQLSLHLPLSALGLESFWAA